jgi:thymidylate synthase
MINNIETEYLRLLSVLVRKPGEYRKDRTGTGTKAVFGRQMRADLLEGFPLLTTKKVSFKNVLVELLWFLKGDTNVRWLQEHNCTIWDEWADANGDLGRVYGAQWRAWQNSRGETVDQIAEAVRLLRVDPHSRRNIVCAWNPGEIKQMALTPCHALFQFFVEDGKLSCQLYQRSADIFLGVPYNIASYAMLTHMMAQQADLQVGEFIWTGGDCHLYSNHMEQAKEQLSRTQFDFPKLIIKRKPESIFDYTLADFEISGYVSHPAIKAPISV